MGGILLLLVSDSVDPVRRLCTHPPSTFALSFSQSPTGAAHTFPDGRLCLPERDLESGALGEVRALCWDPDAVTLLVGDDVSRWLSLLHSNSLERRLTNATID